MRFENVLVPSQKILLTLLSPLNLNEQMPGCKVVPWHLGEMILKALFSGMLAVCSPAQVGAMSLETGLRPSTAS